MGCCLGVTLLAGAPRLALFIWWLFDPARVTGVFNWQTVIGSLTIPAWVWMAAGFLLVPWTTVAFVFIAPGGVIGAEWLVIALGVLLDLGTHGGGGREYSRRRAAA